MSEYRWKDVSVVGFDELMNALDRADRKGYMPDALKEEWEAFNWKPAQSQQEPVAWICYGSNNKHDIDFFEDDIADLAVGTKLYTQAQRTWVGLSEEDREQHRNDWHSNIHDKEFRAIEAKLKEKNT